MDGNSPAEFPYCSSKNLRKNFRKNGFKLVLTGYNVVKWRELNATKWEVLGMMQAEEKDLKMVSFLGVLEGEEEEELIHLSLGEDGVLLAHDDNDEFIQALGESTGYISDDERLEEVNLESAFTLQESGLEIVATVSENDLWISGR
jgi:hypothetical protein